MDSPSSVEVEDEDRYYVTSNSGSFYTSNYRDYELAHNNGMMLIREMRELWQNQQFCDYTLVSGEGREFPVHRVYLACFSDYMKTMLTGQ